MKRPTAIPVAIWIMDAATSKMTVFSRSGCTSGTVVVPLTASVVEFVS